MLLYKYRPLSPFEHVVDILVNERLYCAEYEHLNDPFEGQWIASLQATPMHGTQFDGAPPVETFAANVDLLRRAPNRRVCSLSSEGADVRMWSLYADSHKGVAFEFDFGAVSSAKQVIYSDSPPIFTGAIIGNVDTADVLLHKTRHWEYEQEFRIVTDELFFDARGMLRRVIFGERTPATIVKTLRRVAPSASFAMAAIDRVTGEINIE